MHSALLLVAIAFQDPMPSPPPFIATDVESPQAITKALYNVISGPAGQKRDWKRFKSLFAPKATLQALVKNRQGEFVLVTMTPDEYATRSGPLMEERGFFEKETSLDVTRWEGKNIVNVSSKYESRTKESDEKPFQTGMNLLQLYSDGKRWYVVSILWQGD